MSAGIHIRSTRFPVLPGEDAENVNDGTYGKALATYLSSSLTERGWNVPLVCAEDWGWWVEIGGQPFGLGLCCYGASDAGDRPELYVKVSRSGGRMWSWRQFRTIDTTARVEELLAAVQAILAADPDIEIIALTDHFPLEG